MEELKPKGKKEGFLKQLGFWVILSLFFGLISRPEVLWAQKIARISIGTAQIGGVYYPLGGALANVISKYLPGVEATAEVTNGVVDNAKLLGAGKIDFALMLNDVGYDAYLGKGPFKEKIPIRNLASLYPNVNYLVCLDKKGINSVKDLKGKRVSTNAPGSGAEVIALRVLEAYGIDPGKDIKRERLSAGESVGALKDGKIDAFFWIGAIPGAAIMDLASTPGIKIRLIDQGDAVPKVVEKYGPIYFKTIIPANSYRGVDYDVPTLGDFNSLTCHEKMDERLAYDVLKVLFEHKDELVIGHQVAKDFKLENAVLGSPFPYHPAAIKYFREKGLKITF